MRVLKGVIALIMILLFSCGFSIFAYPYIHNYVVEKDMQEQVQDFWDQLGTDPTAQETLPTEVPTAPTEPTLPPREHEALWEDMLAYNRQIREEKQAGLCDPWSYQQPSFTLGEYGLEDEVFGVITIPLLDLEMPLYLGATSAHMAKGAAHLSQTSLPIGGMNTNCVIAGHRGYNGAAYFRYVTELKPGDEVIITNLWETMTYVVSNAFWLSLISMMKGYTDPRWVTMVQIMDNDGKYHPKQKWHLKAGSKATYVEYWYPYDIPNRKALTWDQYKQEIADGRSDSEFKLSTRYTAVFNACEVEGMPEIPVFEEADITQDELIAKLSAGMEVEILTDGGDRAYYFSFSHNSRIIKEKRRLYHEI